MKVSKYVMIFLAAACISQNAFAQKDLKESIKDSALLLAVEKYDNGAYADAERMLRSRTCVSYEKRERPRGGRVTACR